MDVGVVYRHEHYYFDQDGKPKPKFLLVLARRGDDVIYRLLTSKPRPHNPPCNHAAPYPSYFIGVVGGPLNRESSVDLQPTNDLDGDFAALSIKKGTMHRIVEIETVLLCSILECAAGADDTTMAQERAMRDLLATLR